MHRKLTVCLTLTAGIAAGACSAAPAGTIPPLTFDQGRGTFEVIERLRFEDRSDNFDFDANAHSPTDDSWWVQRLRLGATWKASSDVVFQAQLQDAREWGSERPNVPFILGAEGDEPLNLHVASVTFGNPKTSPVVFTLGRQVIALGEERLVGPGEWNNFARVFDAGKLVCSLVPNQVTATLFVSSVVNVEPTTTGQNWEVEHSSTNDLFSGAYISDKLNKTDTAEAYVLWRDKKDNTPIYSAPTAAIPAPAKTAAAYDIGQNITTFGTRFLRTPAPGAFDAEVEAAVQSGNVDRQTTAATGQYAGNTGQLSQNAWALHTLLGYSPAGAPGKLRFDVEYNVASGDTNRNDGRNGSFMTLFPSGHKWYGFMDLITWKNLREVVGTVRFNPLAQVGVRIDYHSFSLYTDQDAWYRKNGISTVRPLNAAAQSAPTDVGDELDVTATWSPRPWLGVEGGWCEFFAGSYLSATGAHSNATFGYVQTTLKF